MKFTSKQFFLIGVLALLLVTIPLTLYFVKQQQDLRSSAAPSSNLTLVSSKPSVAVGESFTVDVMLDPGQNIPSFIKFSLQFDPSKIIITQITPDPQNISTTLSGPDITENTASVEFGINKIIDTGYDPSGDITQPFKVATIELEALEVTDTPTEISFDFPGSTQVLSISTNDGPGENVLVNAAPTSITILAGGTTSPTPTSRPTISASPPASPTSNPTPTKSPNKLPVCSSLQIIPASGAAPLITQLTAQGNDTDGQVVKATFNFGDGQVIDVTEGLGSPSANIQQSHTYTTANTYNLSVVFTDNDGDSSTACTQTVIVSANTGNSTPSAQTPIAPTEAPIPTIAPPGSIGTMLGVGGAVVITVIGGLLLFLL